MPIGSRVTGFLKTKGPKARYWIMKFLSSSDNDFEYLFAITMMGQPLAWMEAQNLPKEAFICRVIP